MQSFLIRSMGESNIFGTNDSIMVKWESLETGKSQDRGQTSRGPKDLQLKSKSQDPFTSSLISGDLVVITFEEKCNCQ